MNSDIEKIKKEIKVLEKIVEEKMIQSMDVIRELEKISQEVEESEKRLESLYKMLHIAKRNK